MSELEPLEPIVGGVVAPEDLVGRDAELTALLRAVADGGAYVVGDRRMGKTSLLGKAERALRGSSHLPIRVSAETDNLATFQAALLKAIRNERTFGDRWKEWTKGFDGEVTLGIDGSGVTLQGTLRRSGKTPETDIFELCARAAQSVGATVVLMVDEVAQLSWFLDGQNPGSGDELLRTLRRLRQSPSSNVRVVLAGSVGLHHAVNDRTALNDLPEVRVAELEPHDSHYLARRLLLGAADEDLPDVARAMANAVSDIPYYLHALAADMGNEDPRSIDWDERVGDAIDRNAWNTDHYVRRLDRYYGARAADAAAALDAIAASEDGTDRPSVEAELLVTLGAESPTGADLAELLESLRLDHYLTYRSGTYRFASPMLLRIWRQTSERLL